MKNIRIICKLFAERIRANPLVMLRIFAMGITHEAIVVFEMLLPAVLLGLVMGSYNLESIVIIVFLLSTLVSLLNFAIDFQRISVKGYITRATNYWLLNFRKKVHNVNLVTAESLEGQESLWKADYGIYQSSEIVNVVSTLLCRTITLFVTMYIFSNIHILVAVFVLSIVLVEFTFDVQLSKHMVKFEQEIASIKHMRNYMDDTMFELPVVRDIWFSDSTNFFKNHFENVISKVRKIENARKSTNAKYQSAMAFLSMLRTGGVFGVAIWRYSLGELALADFLLFTGAASLLVGAIYQILGSFVGLAKIIPHYEAILSYMKIPDCGHGDNSMPMPSDVREIAFENVTFYYPNQTEPALDNVSFAIGGDDIVALVGDNGAGKSTIIKLILKLYPVTQGRILLNGVDIREYDYDCYRNFFTAVFQDVNIFALTLKENLIFDVEDKNLYKHLQDIRLDKKIKSLPKGLETAYSKRFEEDGVLFSGGEAQKLAIARALCRDFACVMTMDEPTASLDPIAEYDLNRLIYQIKENRFTLFVSHRFSTTRFCNKILVLDKGHLIEIGSHEELIAREGKYKQMYAMQIAFLQYEL